MAVGTLLPGKLRHAPRKPSASGPQPGNTPHPLPHLSRRHHPHVPPLVKKDADPPQPLSQPSPTSATVEEEGGGSAPAVAGGGKVEAGPNEWMRRGVRRDRSRALAEVDGSLS